MTGAVLAGALSGLGAVLLGNFYDYPPELKKKLISPNAELDFQEIAALDREYLLKNTTLCGLLGGLSVVGLIGVGAGYCRSRAAAATGLLLGVILGAVLGALGGLAGAAAWQAMVDAKLLLEGDDTSTHAAIANSILWAVIGIGAGLVAAMGGSAQRYVSGALAGLFGGAIGAFFLLVAALAMPDARIGLPIPENLQSTSTIVARVLWALLPATMIGLLIAIGIPSTEQSRTENTPAADTEDSV
jgi:hypothetical protein